ncbi:putative Cystatin domain-containing protein [Medicago truncatula]|uniref:Cystatin domain protein n=1 Tax=Medicago truncatula TaxID=3880 RepID=A0A072THD2_MEDTR|nr:cysteine proteinase inhibitor 3 [Medicago truncatula]KEH16348.1 cystatin domain protein [Medicago truncatula]RHN60710.1 putative Cystatin domain-containing protein [Medicago truncatula]
MKFQSLILILIFLLASTARNQALLDGYYPILPLNGYDVIEIAKFAVTEYDKQTGAKLKFKNIIKGESKFAEGFTGYHLIISADNGSISNNYETFVCTTVYVPTWKLISFRPVQV